MAPVDIAFLTLGIIAAIVNVLSYQIKQQRYYLFFQMIMATILVIQYGIIGAWAGMILNIIAATRALAFYFNKHERVGRIVLGTIFSLLNVAAVIVVCVCFKEYWYMGLVIGVAQIVGTIAIATGSNRTVKIAQMFIVSPCWLAYAAFYTAIGHPNYGGIIMETCNILSIIIFFIRIKYVEKKKEEVN